MKRTFRFFLTMLLLIAGTSVTWADFKDFSAILNNGAGTMLLPSEYAQDQTVVETFGIAVDNEGNCTRVAADSPSAVATVAGKYWNSHGMNSLVVTVPNVSGTLKITTGNCQFSNDRVVKDASGNTLQTIGHGDNCFAGSAANVTEAFVVVGETPQTITINGGNYCGFVKVEKVNAVINKYNVTYVNNDDAAAGTVPAAVSFTEGDAAIAAPKNFTLWKEGFTLTGWNDGTKTYAVGETFTPVADMTLSAVFTQNNVALADRTEPVTLKWNFRRDQGAPVLAYEGKAGFYVTQGVVNGQSIDVRLDFNTSPGKLNNANHNDWAQVNNGTTFTIPSCKGAVVSLETYNAISATTIDGVAAEGNTSKIYSTEVGSKAETIDIVVADGSYYRYIQTVLPVVEAAGSVKKEKLLYSSDFSDWTASGSADNNDVTVKTTDGQDLTFSLHFTTVEPTKWDANKFKEPSTTGSLVAQKNKVSTITTSALKSITKMSWVHCATGSSRGWGLKVKGDGDEDWVTVSSAVANPASGSKVEVDVNRENVQLQFYNLADAQNAFMTEIEINGMVEVVGETYTIETKSNIEEAGTTSVYPKADDYVAGDEITLTATENFGYDFVNWTNSAGEEVSKEAKCKVTVTANEIYTANFVKVETYALNLSIDGGANDYMISLNPAPVVVDGKNMYEAGTKVIITASENPILTFTNWSDGQTEKEIVYTMDADKSLTAFYSAIDFIVGWDFMKAGNSSRKADFYAAENDAVTLDMYKADGSLTSWLDKSQLSAGGYEGRPGAVCWVQGTENGDVGNCGWHTKVNAEAFSDIKIITAMVYNYNSYQTYNVDVSTDGENWEKAGSINMPGAKNWTDATFNLATKYSNQKELYIRWVADKSSSVDGTASKNDGACLGATYIIATAKLIDDGTAPKLVSSVPAEGADNASANGKIVLTFDEKVKVAENAVATINGTQLKPAVSGKTVTFEYKGLEYSTPYTFTLPANSVADLTDNYITTPISINFQTKTKPAIEKGMYDVIIMLTDEKGNEYTAEELGKQLADAITTANKRADQNKRFRILVPPTTIKIPAYEGDVTVSVELADGSTVQKTYKEPRTYITGNNISIIGFDYEKTIITNSTPTETYTGKFGNANISEGIGNNDVLQISGTGTYFQGVTIKTGIGDALGRDIAVHDKGNKTIFKDARLWGYQDTYTNNSGKGRTYFEGGVVRGRTDYLCGKADIWFEGVTLQQCGKGGYPIVPSTPKQYGWIFNRCTLSPETSDVTCTLGRPWGSGTPIALLINTTMEVVPGAEGWSEMSNGWPKRFAEYNSMTKSGTAIDLSKRKTTFGEHPNCNNPILTAAEAAEYSISKVMGADDDWDPTAATEQASAPSNAICDKDGKLTWDNSNYVLGWIIYVDDEPLAYATENSFDLSAFYNGDFTVGETFKHNGKDVRLYISGVNEMGGIGMKNEIVSGEATGIKGAISGTANASEMFNIAGQKVGNNAKGIVINKGKKMIK